MMLLVNALVWMYGKEKLVIRVPRDLRAKIVILVLWVIINLLLA